MRYIKEAFNILIESPVTNDNIAYDSIFDSTDNRTSSEILNDILACARIAHNLLTQESIEEKLNEGENDTNMVEITATEIERNDNLTDVEKANILSNQPQTSPYVGYIYVARNVGPLMRNDIDWCKIGYADDVDKRLKDFNGTTETTRDWECFGYFPVTRRLLDTDIHDILDEINPELRVDVRREFYYVSPDKAYKIIEVLSKISKDIGPGTKYNLNKQSKVKPLTTNAAQAAANTNAAAAANLASSKAEAAKEMLDIIQQTLNQAGLNPNKTPSYNEKFISFPCAKSLTGQIRLAHNKLDFEVRPDIDSKLFRSYPDIVTRLAKKLKKALPEYEVHPNTSSKAVVCSQFVENVLQLSDSELNEMVRICTVFKTVCSDPLDETYSISDALLDLTNDKVIK